MLKMNTAYVSIINSSILFIQVNNVSLMTIFVSNIKYVKKEECLRITLHSDPESKKPDNIILNLLPSI